MQELEHAISTIRVRFGSQALTRAAEMPPPQPWPSRTELDRLTGIGGLPRGRLVLLTGNGTCGKLTLALGLLATATREFAHTVVIDPRGDFDPWALLPFDPELSSLTVVRLDPDSSGEAATALARTHGGRRQPLGVGDRGSGPCSRARVRARVEREPWLHSH